MRVLIWYFRSRLSIREVAACDDTIFLWSALLAQLHELLLKIAFCDSNQPCHAIP